MAEGLTSCWTTAGVFDAFAASSSSSSSVLRPRQPKFITPENTYLHFGGHSHVPYVMMRATVATRSNMAMDHETTRQHLHHYHDIENPSKITTSLTLTPTRSILRNVRNLIVPLDRYRPPRNATRNLFTSITGQTSVKALKPAGAYEPAPKRSTCFRP